MGYDLRSRSGNAFRFGADGFKLIFQLALVHDWKPAGTTLYLWREGKPDQIDLDWQGQYFSNDGQEVCAEDSLSLARAIERSLDDIPDITVPAEITDVFGALSGTDWKGYLREFIEFCRGGSFLIL